MDLQELERRLDAARTFDHPLGPITYRLRMPNRLQFGRVMAAMRELVQLDEAGPETAAKLLEVISPHVVGMVGATSADVCISGAPEPLPDSPESARLVLAERLEDAARLVHALSSQMVARNAALQADRKN